MEIIKKNIIYLGIDNPGSPAQVKVEIAGLRHGIKQAEEIITRLEQAMSIMELKQEELADEQSQAKSGEKTVDPETEESPEERGAVSGEV